MNVQENLRKKKGKQNSCELHARLLLRSGSNLRIPDIQVSLNLPYRDSPLYRILSKELYFGILSTGDNWTKENLLKVLRKSMSRNPKIKEMDLKEIESFSDRELEYVINQIFADKNPPDDMDKKISELSIKREEFRGMIDASLHGRNPEHSGKYARFEIERTKVRKIEADSNKWNIPFIVTPVKTLSVLLVQRGYRREVGSGKGEMVLTFYDDGKGNAWFPGMETTGEGIFIYIPEEKNPPHGNGWKEWMNIYTDKRKKESITNPNPDQYYKFNPLFVWWHSLSHRIINSLAVDSGYSSASIRERIYIDIDVNNPELARGGILLYAAQTGGDGTLGGLISQVANFENIFKKSSNGLKSCSNDPLCAYNKINDSKENGAACYTCMLLSETSCEYRNRFLDRNLL